MGKKGDEDPLKAGWQKLAVIIEPKEAAKYSSGSEVKYALQV
jgi:hypothetical protein